MSSVGGSYWCYTSRLKNGEFLMKTWIGSKVSLIKYLKNYDQTLINLEELNEYQHMRLEKIL